MAVHCDGEYFYGSTVDNKIRSNDRLYLFVRKNKNLLDCDGTKDGCKGKISDHNNALPGK